MLILATLAGVGSIACWIMTLIKMFKNENIGLAILGIICPLWAYIWGWINKDKLGHKQLMLIWTGCWVLGMIFNGIAGAISAANAG